MIPRLLLLLAAALTLSSCAAPPVETVHLALESGRRAVEAKAKIHAPQEYREYEYALARARRFQQEEDSRLIAALRDYSAVLGAYALARQRGEEAREASLRRQAELKAESQGEMLLVDQELSEMRDLAGNVPVGRSSLQQLAEAEVLVEEAARLIELGEYAKAKAAAAKALDKVSLVQNRAGVLLDRYGRPELLERWRGWVRDTVEWSRLHEEHAVVIDKSRHTCTVFHGGRVKAVFQVNLGVNGLNQKYRAGDLATPEGRYHVVRKQDVGQSRYYKGLLLNYPNDEDWERFNQAKRERFISAGSRIGGLIMIHGEGRKSGDWTQGCVALLNPDMERLFAWAEVGIPVTIVGRGPTSFGATSDRNDVVSRAQAKVVRRNGSKGAVNRSPASGSADRRASGS